MLTRFPPELLTAVARQVRHIDISWRVESLSQAPLGFIRQLNLCAEVNDLYSCPHEMEQLSDANDIEFTPFEHITNEAETILGWFQEGQLQGFRWDMGSCVPREILGSHGVIATKHPALQHLHITTDPTCMRRDDCDISLSPFCNLKSLSWRGSWVEDIDKIAEAVHRNLDHLETLELDFINLNLLKEHWDSYSDDSLDGFLPESITEIGSTLSLPLFTTLKTLTLTQVPLGVGLASAINLDTLQSLTIRHCPAMAAFLNEINGLRNSLPLRALEIQGFDHNWVFISDTVYSFLGRLKRLENLFLGLPGGVEVLLFWNHISNIATSLKRFVYHQRRTEMTAEAFESVKDEGDLSIPNHRLETESGLRRYDSWVERSEPGAHSSVLPGGALGLEDTFDNLYTEGSVTELKSQFVQFVIWAFGPDGVSSLDSIVYGDFGNDNDHSTNLVIVRDRTGDKPFKRLKQGSEQREAIKRSYRDVLGSCPVEPLFDLPRSRLGEMPDQFW
ncbi:hypothetical protein NM208_g10146 [Fusarium decemcellulare]|uniref:Uncharacterized protein n=1 Tax=Fusarium decemcellulare TaxID=57161 RepID=A0ACC1RYY7_9HYPO|nr:hypothetical protein NM208_g10146 [Fusarium decemcellulare]